MSWWILQKLMNGMMNFLMGTWTNLLASRSVEKTCGTFAVFCSQEYEFKNHSWPLQLQIVIIALLSPVVAAECTRFTGQVPRRDGT